VADTDTVLGQHDGLEMVGGEHGWAQ
jgi:hypothetical protein